MKLSEAQVQNQILEYLLYAGYLVIRINQGAMHTDERFVKFARWQYLGSNEEFAGISDILALSPRGTLFAIEVKSQKVKPIPSDKQLIFLNAIEDHGGIAICTNNLDEVIQKVETERMT